MAGLLGLDRSYLAALETGARPLKPWILGKANEVERRMKGINFAKLEGRGDDAKASDFSELAEVATLLTTDELGEVCDHLLEGLHDSPRIAAVFYEPALKIVLDEIRRRLFLSGGKSVKRNAGLKS